MEYFISLMPDSQQAKQNPGLEGLLAHRTEALLPFYRLGKTSQYEIAFYVFLRYNSPKGKTEPIDHLDK